MALFLIIRDKLIILILNRITNLNNSLMMTLIDFMICIRTLT